METDERTPARDTYDAEIDVMPNPGEPGRAHAWVKQTYDLAGGGCRAAEPEPLLHDLRDPNLQPRIVAGTDFFWFKEATDVVVRGSAFAQTSGVRQMEVVAQVGASQKRVAVFGPRAVTWGGDGRPVIGAPEPFEAVPMTWDHAYGGVDARVVPEDLDDPMTRLMLDVDLPGLYPRNAAGYGYLVDPEPIDDVLMPQLEDPDDLLTAERLVVGDARRWYMQPLPWCLDWVHPETFPRKVLFAAAADAWYPGPEDASLPEVRRGYLMEGYRSQMEQHGLERGPHPSFCQGASHGMVFTDLQPNTPISIKGMHPDRSEVSFSLPAPPRLEITVEGDRQAVQPRLHSVVIRPAEERLTMTYAADRPLTRPLIPGVHGKIPVSLTVDGDAPVDYETPTPVRERLAATQAQAGQKSRKRRRRRRKKDRRER